MIEIEAKNYAMYSLDEYMKVTRNPNSGERAAWTFAKTKPAARSNVNLTREGWGPTKNKSFTLTKRTREWLEHSTRGMGRMQTASKTVEVALCRYRMWRPLMDYITELTTTIVELKKELKELKEGVQ